MGLKSFYNKGQIEPEPYGEERHFRSKYFDNSNLPPPEYPLDYEVRSQQKHYSPLMYAVSLGLYQIVKILVDR